MLIDKNITASIVVYNEDPIELENVINSFLGSPFSNKIYIIDNSPTNWLKEKIIGYLTEKGYELKDFGCYSTDSIDYPDFGHKVAQSINDNAFTYGIVICGSGNGINMTANKHQAIRSALCWNAEIAELARLHNNANILSIPARYTSIPQAIAMVKIFINTDFEGGRHQKRVDKISCL